jgi:V/A-type H+-transporting ATPase subunit K
MAKVDEGHGKFIGMSAAPATQTIYGIVLMFILLGKVSSGAGLAIFGIGFFCGTGIMLSAIYQGKVAATGILASSKKPEIFGKCFAAVGITESFAIFCMVFGIIIAGSISG